MKKSLLALLVAATSVGSLWANPSANPSANTPANPTTDEDMICTHKVVLAPDNTLLAWYNPQVPGAAYSYVAKLASKFLKDLLPVDEATGLRYYYMYASFEGFQNSANDNFRGETHRSNPACVAAGLTESLAVKHYMYDGDAAYLQLVRENLDFMLSNATTPADFHWASCPYASSDPGSTIIQGTNYYGNGNGDAYLCLEPDKVGEMGVAYLQFYQITEEQKYLDAALSCADALAANVREGNYKESPWPYRVHARTNLAMEEYCSYVIPPVRLFDMLASLNAQLKLGDERMAAYKRARDMAWEWLFSLEGPMKTYVWKGYFEDVPYDHDNKNRVQIAPMETARYLIENADTAPFLKENVPALIHYCNATFGTDNALGYNAQCEQSICMLPMGSHTARYASVCAMWYNLCGEDWYKKESFENFNWATYCTSETGYVAVGPTYNPSWFSDGYGDYIKHFFDGIAALPEWAPSDENHLLKSSSVVQSISYEPTQISYKTFLPNAKEILRLTKMPKQILVDGKPLKRVDDATNDEGWSWEKLGDGGVVRLNRLGGRDVLILLK